jgi:hypothetical protein
MDGDHADANSFEIQMKLGMEMAKQYFSENGSLSVLF